MGNCLRKREKYNLNQSIILEFMKDLYDFIKELIKIIKSDFRNENFEIPTCLLKEAVINFERFMCFVINLTFAYDFIRLFC
jgi:hypothetical protein